MLWHFLLLINRAPVIAEDTLEFERNQYFHLVLDARYFVVLQVFLQLADAIPVAIRQVDVLRISNGGRVSGRTM